MYNRWAVDLLNRMKHDPDLEQVDWIIRFRKDASFIWFPNRHEQAIRKYNKPSYPITI